MLWRRPLLWMVYAGVEGSEGMLRGGDGSSHAWCFWYEGWGWVIFTQIVWYPWNKIWIGCEMWICVYLAVSNGIYNYCLLVFMFLSIGLFVFIYLLFFYTYFLLCNLFIYILISLFQSGENYGDQPVFVILNAEGQGQKFPLRLAFAQRQVCFSGPSSSN